MPSTDERGIWGWVREYVSPAAAVLTVLDALVAAVATSPAVEMFHPIINPFWIYAAAYFSVAVPLSFAFAPLAGWTYERIGEWWNRDERLFRSMRSILETLLDWERLEPEVGGLTDGDRAAVNQLHADLRSRLVVLRIRTDVDRDALFVEVVYGTLRRARKL